jgi:hypothetical protein
MASPTVSCRRTTGGQWLAWPASRSRKLRPYISPLIIRIVEEAGKNQRAGNRLAVVRFIASPSPTGLFDTHQNLRPLPERNRASSEPLLHSFGLVVEKRRSTPSFSCVSLCTYVLAPPTVGTLAVLWPPPLRLRAAPLHPSLPPTGHARPYPRPRPRPAPALCVRRHRQPNSPFFFFVLLMFIPPLYPPTNTRALFLSSVPL